LLGVFTAARMPRNAMLSAFVDHTAVMLSADTGFFGPDTELWRVLCERTVVMGGLRALLMHAAHPLVAAATAESGMYERDPVRRHERTLRLTFTLIFGGRQEAAEAAAQINVAHRSVHGIDKRTGLAYDARDPELLLWVHASLVSSFLLFERLTIGRLDDRGRQQFHEEAIRMAGLLGLPASCAPERLEDLSSWIDATIGSGILQPTPSSRTLLGIVRGREGGAPDYRSRAVGFMALHSLPAPLRDLYEVDHSRADDRRLAALGGALKVSRLVLPPKARYIGPAICAYARLRGETASVAQAEVLPQRWRERDAQ